jgi:RHS repeat-associated protein
LIFKPTYLQHSQHIHPKPREYNSHYEMTAKCNNGQANQATDDQGNASQYTARENDGTGLYYYRARYYMPSCGRFISEDPIGTSGGINLYGYVGGDPVNATDPMGLAQCDVDAALDVVKDAFPNVRRPFVSIIPYQRMKNGEDVAGIAYTRIGPAFPWWLEINSKHVDYPAHLGRHAAYRWEGAGILETVIHEYGHALQWPHHGPSRGPPTEQSREYQKRVDDIFDRLEGPFERKRREYCERK